MSTDTIVYVFWIAAGVTIYPYTLYPFALFFAYAACQTWRDWRYLVAQEDRRVERTEKIGLPDISVVLAENGDERDTRAALAALRQSDYPPAKLEIIITQEEHGGQLPRTRSEWVVFCTADATVDAGALASLARHFGGPNIGMVCASVRARRRSLFWSFESALDLMESRLGAAIPARRSTYAVRRCCYPEIAGGVMPDNLAVGLAVRRAGYRVVYDPEAIATELRADAGIEYRRGVRMAAGAFRMLFDALRTPMNPAARVCLFSNKLLRRLLPFPMVAAFASNAFLLSDRLYQATFAAQFGFYILALCRGVWRQRASVGRSGVMSRGAAQG